VISCEPNVPVWALITARASGSPSLKLIFFLPICYGGMSLMADRVERRFYEFGCFRLDPAGRVLFRGDQVIPLPPKAADTLLLLVQDAGNVVEKQDLLKNVWQDAFVEEGSLTRTISILRTALEGGAHGKEFISTIPKRGYRFAARVEGLSSHPVSPLASKIMLAVLPFENMSGQKRQEYFSDGLTEEMITQLGRMNPDRLGVIARTSAMRYKNATKTADQIGQELHVSHILEGSVRRASGRVRIAAQLIQVSDQTHLWAESYERGVTDILALQSDVAQAIARQIQIKLMPQARERLAASGSMSPDAYEAYLRGRHLWNQRTPQALQKSVTYFEKAIQIDPAYAPAYAGMADSYLTQQDDGLLPTLKATAKAKRAAGEALQRDAMLAEPHISLAHAYFHEFNWRASEREFKCGLELNPNYAVGHFYFANYLLAKGQFEDALAEARQAKALDPVSLPVRSNTAMALYYCGQYDEAIEQCLQVLEIDPNFARTYEDLGRVYWEKGMRREAIRAFKKAVSYSGRGSMYMAELAYAYAGQGKQAEAVTLLRELTERARKRYVSAYAFVLIYTGMGNKDQAFAWLDKAYEERASTLPFLKTNPSLASLRSDSRFQTLIRRMNLAS
jgi:TolB-like protein/Tfp pilus assembly protein PilF